MNALPPDWGWLYDYHLLGVEKFAVELLEKLPEANK